MAMKDGGGDAIEPKRQSLLDKDERMKKDQVNFSCIILVLCCIGLFMRLGIGLPINGVFDSLFVIFHFLGILFSLAAILLVMAIVPLDENRRRTHASIVRYCVLAAMVFINIAIASLVSSLLFPNLVV